MNEPAANPPPKKKGGRPVKLSPDLQLLVDYGILGARRGCPLDQIENFFKAGVFLQPKQLEMAAAARKCDHRCPECSALFAAGKPIKEECRDCGPTAIGVGGARGGGKSAWMFAQICLDDCQRFPGLKFLLLRKSAKALREQVRDLLKKTCANLKYNYREQAGVIEFGETGSQIIIGHFKDESEINNFLGQEYDGIAIEELTTLTFDKWKNLMSCLRSSKVGWRPRFYGAWNWGGLGHAWVKQVFYDPYEQKREITTRYVLATVTDNRYNNPEYINTLRSYVGWKYQSWFLGDPNFAAGNFFNHYRQDVHVYPNDIVDLNPADIVRWWGSMDYGSSHPNCFHLHCETKTGDIFTVAESHTSEETIADNCEMFRDILRLKNLDINDLEHVFSGQDVKQTDRKTREDGSTIETEFRENGVMLTPITINRVNAFSQMQERLGNIERGVRPTWFIHRSCTYLQTQIQCAQCDPKKPNDILKMNVDLSSGTDEGGDNALESARNGIVGAYETLLSDAKPVSMGNYQSLTQIVEPEFVDVEMEMEKAENADFEANQE